jgi:hypothetical protein
MAASRRWPEAHLLSYDWLTRNILRRRDELAKNVSLALALATSSIFISTSSATYLHLASCSHLIYWANTSAESVTYTQQRQSQHHLRAMALLTYRPPVNYEEQQGDHAPGGVTPATMADHFQLHSKTSSELSNHLQSQQLMR